MKLPLYRIDPINRALLSTETFGRVVTENGKDRVVGVAYAFSSKMTWDKVANLQALRTTLQGIEDGRLIIAARHGAENKGPVPEERRAEYILEYAAALQEEREINLTPFTMADLNIYDPKTNPQGNKIPAEVILDLLPLISDAPGR